MKALTASGAGLVLDGEELDREAPAAQLRELLRGARFLVLRGGPSDVHEAVDLMRRLGPINEARTRREGAVLVDAQADDEVFRSNAALPMHKDGILTGFDVLFVGIYCLRFRSVTGGRTYVSDATAALETLPGEDRELLASNGIEVLAVDATGYYRSEFEGRWSRFPGLFARPGAAPTLHLALPHLEGEPESWRIRIPDVPAPVSDALFDRLRAALFDERHVYHHAWQEGDLLLMDNYAVMHGREAFQAEQRVLANIQVLPEEAS